MYGPGLGLRIMIAMAEEQLIKAFVAPARQERYLSLLASAKGREKFLARLAHHMAKELNPDCAQSINGSAKEIETLLKAKGAPDTCYVVSENSKIDGKEMKLLEALEEVVGYGMGTFVSCVPGTISYFEGEDKGQRYILERKKAA